ncbi:hypothetical protein PCE1_004246 [Barthelona sp. PCE]
MNNNIKAVFERYSSTFDGNTGEFETFLQNLPQNLLKEDSDAQYSEFETCTIAFLLNAAGQRYKPKKFVGYLNNVLHTELQVPLADFYKRHRSLLRNLLLGNHKLRIPTLINMDWRLLLNLGSSIVVHQPQLSIEIKMELENEEKIVFDCNYPMLEHMTSELVGAIDNYRNDFNRHVAYELQE